MRYFAGVLAVVFALLLSVWPTFEYVKASPRHGAHIVKITDVETTSVIVTHTFSDWVISPHTYDNGVVSPKSTMTIHASPRPESFTDGWPSGEHGPAVPFGLDPVPKAQEEGEQYRHTHRGTSVQTASSGGTHVQHARGKPAEPEFSVQDPYAEPFDGRLYVPIPHGKEAHPNDTRIIVPVPQGYRIEWGEEIIVNMIDAVGKVAGAMPQRSFCGCAPPDAACLERCEDTKKAPPAVQPRAGGWTMYCNGGATGKMCPMEQIFHWFSIFPTDDHDPNWYSLNPPDIKTKAIWDHEKCDKKHSKWHITCWKQRRGEIAVSEVSTTTADSGTATLGSSQRVHQSWTPASTSMMSSTVKGTTATHAPAKPMLLSQRDAEADPNFTITSPSWYQMNPSISTIPVLPFWTGDNGRDHGVAGKPVPGMPTNGQLSWGFGPQLSYGLVTVAKTVTRHPWAAGGE
ncbi:MAG: hypothetical protein M1827_000334 [Pycnora praestabilis]|nr:MAG: hypothetical protein M1827_000334 [Pycnora praestabilis]